jgi:hypothetical protein
MGKVPVTPVQPNQIHEDADFQRRRNGVERAHVRTLSQAMRNAGGKLDPILLWRETTDRGSFTGRLILLDGAHRLAAHSITTKGRPPTRQGIPARVISCSRDEALLLATSSRSKDALPLSNYERMDAAWLLVRKLQNPLSKAKIALAAGVSPRTVASMRLRFRVMTEAASAISGQWWQDRSDDLEPLEAEAKLTTAARKEAIATVAKAVRKACEEWMRRDIDLVAEALLQGLGHKHRHMAEYLYGTPDDGLDIQDEADDQAFYDRPIGTRTGTANGDGNGDF